MPLIERYLFRQLLVTTIWASIALGLIGILSQSLSGLELIVDQRQSGWVFAKVTLLAMPKMMALIIPLAAYVAALATFNRLHTEHEIVVCYAGGISRWRIASSAMRLGGWLVLVTLAINLWVQPLASRNMREELNAARADLAAALVREGQFSSPSEGLTLYAETVERGGLMKNLFIEVEGISGRSGVYTAAEAQLIERGDQPILLLIDAAVQRFTAEEGLDYLAFDDYQFDLSDFQVTGAAPTTKAADRYMSELLNPAPGDEWGQNNRNVMRAEFHGRIAGPIYNLAFLALAMVAILGGRFSRLGYGRRVAIVSLIAISTRIAGFVVQEAASENPSLNALQYVIPSAVFVLALGPFLFGGRRRRSERHSPLAEAAA